VQVSVLGLAAVLAAVILAVARRLIG